MKLSEVLEALEKLGVEVNHDLMRVSIDSRCLVVTYIARDDDGSPFANDDNDVATNTVSYRIEDDQWIQTYTTKSPADRVADARQRSI